MANTPEYSWPPMDKRKIIGKPYKRVDGPMKATGYAKYSSDHKPQGMLFAAYLTSPHAHARITSIDTSEAERMPGVKAVHVVAPAGTELQWPGMEIAAVAATTEETAQEATRRIEVQYEVLPHLVNEADLSKVGAHGKPAGEVVTGDPDKAFQEAEISSEGQYGIPVVTHCCLEPHGQVVQWQGTGSDSHLEVMPSTQNVPGYANALSQPLKVPAANIHVHMDYIGGGFGSKFGPDAWGTVSADLSQKAGGRPVKVFLDRATEQMIAGNRPSLFGKIKVGGKKDGTITAWQQETWGTGGLRGENMPGIVPYVFTNIPNVRKNHTSVATNCGPERAWRAPGNQQASYLTCCAIDDFAHKAGLDPLDVFMKNAQYAPGSRIETYRYQFQKAAELSEWKKLWRPRGTSSGPVKRGLGMAYGAWGGGGHSSQCRATIHPDGSVGIDIDTQDLGTGTRTVITQVAAETFGLPTSHIRLRVGDSNLPPDNASGGSTTVGGVSTSTRKATINALMKLFEACAPALGAQPEELEAVDGHVRVKSNPAKRLTWAAACRKMGSNPISEMGTFNGRANDSAGLNTSGTCGAQVADLSVDTETGMVKINRYVVVQDCGMVINPRLAESQVYGAVIMGISTALFEERVMDDQTGRMLNPDMEFYKLAGIADVGNIVVHMDIRPENDKRGVIGLGEPPAIPICAAIGNAVTNAIGIRVPKIPMTPQHILDALEGRNA